MTFQQNLNDTSKENDKTKISTERKKEKKQKLSVAKL
jgi:hypothetical protein